MVSAYAMIYRYLIHVVLHYALGKLRQKFENATGVNWKAQRESVEEKNKGIQEAVGSLSASKVSRGLEEVEKRIDEGIKNVTHLQEDTLVCSFPGDSSAGI